MTDSTEQSDWHAWLCEQFGSHRMLLSLREVAGVIGLHPDSLRRAITQRRTTLPAIKVHGRYRIRIDTFAGWLERQ